MLYSMHCRINIISSCFLIVFVKKGGSYKLIRHTLIKNMVVKAQNTTRNPYRRIRKVCGYIFISTTKIQTWDEMFSCVMCLCANYIIKMPPSFVRLRRIINLGTQTLQQYLLYKWVCVLLTKVSILLVNLQK